MYFMFTIDPAVVHLRQMWQVYHLLASEHQTLHVLSNLGVYPVKPSNYGKLPRNHSRQAQNGKPYRIYSTLLLYMAVHGGHYF